MTVEEKYLLRKPGYGDTADIKDINHNTDLIANGMYQNRLMIGKAYNPDREEPYMKGDLVVKQTTVLEDGSPVAYNFEYYKALEDNITGVWDSSKWELTDISTELATKGGADVTKTASGNPIEISDAASAPLVKCVTQITGSQDLHGYSKPWVGGAEKNKLENTATTTTVKGVTFTVNSDGTVVANGTATGGNADIALTTMTLTEGQILSGSVGSSGSTYGLGISGIGIVVGNGEHAITSGETGSKIIYIRIVNGNTVSNVKFYPMLRASGTTADFAPYSNICPITAYTEGEIEVRGKNLFDKSSATQNYRVITLNGELEYSSGAYASDYTAVTPSTTYTMNFVYYSAANFGMAYYDANKVYISGEKQRTQEGDTSFTFTTPNNCKYIRFTIGSDVSINNVQLEKGSTSTTYEPYTSTTHTTTYPSAIYRGSEDVVNGEVTSEWVKETFDGTLHGTYTLISSGRLNIDIDISYQHNVGLTGKSVSSQYEELEQTSSNSEFDALASNKDGVYNLNANTSFKVIRIKDSRFTDLTTAISILAQTPLEVAFQLATPTTSSVTPTNLPIKSLSGYNHIESSTGDMEVEYITEEYQPLVDLIQSSKHVYSTNEQVVGKWIDGSDVYEKTYDIGYLTSNNKTIAHGISGFGHIIQVHGYVTNGTYDFHLPHVTTDAVSCVGVHVDSTNIYITSYDRSDYHGYVIIQYTKSTPTRSLNLTKPAIPDEIKNAEYEEKPDVNEADDDAPTEVDER